MVTEPGVNGEVGSALDHGGLGRGWFRAFVRNPGLVQEPALDPATGSSDRIVTRASVRRQESPVWRMSSMHCGLS
jgi:hypothetical protein